MKLLYMILLYLLSNQCFGEVSVIDDENTRLVLSKPAQRIVSLAPHLTEMIYAAGAGEKLVAVVAYSDYPEAAKKIPQVGSYISVNTEAILLHKPDLIVAWGSNGMPALQLEKVKSLGIPVYVNKPSSIDDIPDTLKRISQLANTRSAANITIDKFNNRYTALRDQYKNKKPVSVFYQIWDRPLMTINGKHFISDAISLCGGKNVFPALPALAAKISNESVLHANPQVIIAGGMQNEQVNWLNPWRKWKQIMAVRRNQLYSLPPDILQRHSPRILDGTEQLCQVIDEARQVYYQTNVSQD